MFHLHKKQNRKERKEGEATEGREDEKEGGKSRVLARIYRPAHVALADRARSLGAFVIVTQGIAIVLQMMEPEQRKQRNQSLANEGATRPLPPRTTDAGSEGIIRPESKGPTGR